MNADPGPNLPLEIGFPDPSVKHGRERARQIGLFRLGVLISLLTALMALAAFTVVQQRISAERAIADSQHQIALQHATGALADKVRALFSSQDQLVRLASLELRLAECCDKSARDAADAALVEAVRQNPLGLQALALRDETGATLLSVGVDPQGAPNEPVTALGMGLSWRTPTGRHIAHFTRLMPSMPGVILRVTVDLDVLASAAEVAAPPGSVTRLYRLFDGAELAPLTFAEIMPASTPVAPIAYLDRETVGQFASNDHGWIVTKGPHSVTSMMAFVTLHELGLVVSARRVEARATATLPIGEQALWLAPMAVLLAGLVVTAIILNVARRHHARFRLEEAALAMVGQQAAQRELEALVTCSPAMLYRGRMTVGGEFVREYLTPNTLQVTGWSQDVLTDPDKLWDLLTDDDRLLREINHKRAAREGRSAAEYRLQRPDGSFAWLRNEAVALRQLPGGEVEVAGAISNITREREIAAYAAMQNRLASLGEISASLAHELTQPMTVIGIASALAQRALDSQPEKLDLSRHLKTIGEQTERASDIIRHLRAYGRMDGGALVDVSLRAAVHGALGLVGMALRESAVDVVVEIADELPPVRARQVQVEQVLVNLIINARDAMSANPPSARRVTLRARVVGGSVRLDVEDTGPGVPTALVERLFEPFFTTKSAGEGTGLGLSLCQTMMRQFGGSISVANGRMGAVFTLQFPIDTAKKA
ncbi:MAG: ATP-binding protein [Acetobacteraceae bacterium]|nr:ATP-binding protein [Acetobacteraceae bacterium]